MNIVTKWSYEWKLTLNASKSEVAFFSTYIKKSKSQPYVKIPFNKRPKLLGVYLDHQLSFEKQTKKVTKAATLKIEMIRAVANTIYGWGRDELKNLYFSFVRSRFDYAGPMCQPWLSDTNLTFFEVVQNKGLRLSMQSMVSLFPAAQLKPSDMRDRSRVMQHTWKATA